MPRRIHRRHAIRMKRLGTLAAAFGLLLAGLPSGGTSPDGLSWRLHFVPPANADDKKESKSSERRESSESHESHESHESNEHEDHDEHEHSFGGSGSFEAHGDSGEKDGDAHSKSESWDDGRKGRRDPYSESRIYYKRGEARHDDHRPPRTLKEMLERVLGEDKPARAERPARAGRTGSGVSRPLAPIGHRDYANDEVLAVNLSQQGAARAQRLGFKIRGNSQMPHGGGSVTRLRTPPGVGALKGRDMLNGRVPGERFALNQIHRPYHIANKDMNAESRTAIPARHGGLSACSGDRCYPRRLIRWHDAVQPCARGLRVGVIDTHIDQHHPAFARAALNVGGFLPDGREAAPDWHGTGVLALLAGDPQSGTPGLIPSANFYVASIFFQDSEGEVATDTVSVLGALEWMDAFDVKVINMSFSGPKDTLIEKAIEDMSRRGVIFVAAAGNDGPTAEPAYPAAYKPVIAVTAVTKELRSYPYANRGERIDVAAPGVNIWSAVPRAREGFHTGTSFAAPYVTAIFATLYNGAANSGKDELLNRVRIMDLGPSGRDPIYGRGLVLAPTKCGLTDGTVAQVPQGPQVPGAQQPSPGWGASIKPGETAAFR